MRTRGDGTWCKKTLGWRGLKEMCRQAACPGHVSVTNSSALVHNQRALSREGIDHLEEDEQP